MLQKITLIGNLGSEPELRYTAQGDAVTNFSVATNRKWTDNQGNKAEETTWFRVSVWGKQAEACNQWLAKGRQVYVEGRMVPDQNGGPRLWTDQQGNVRSSFEVRALTVQFLGGGNQQQAQAQPQPKPQQAPQPQAQPQPIDDDEIPF